MCGSPLTDRNQKEPGRFGLTTCSLDDAEAFPPTHRICEPKTEVETAIDEVGFRHQPHGEATMITGSCLCGGVRYEIDGRIGPALNWHCSMCRKATGAAFRSRVAVPRDHFRWTTGEDLLTDYHSSSTTTRTFGKVCGSTLISLFHDNPETLGLPMGTLDNDPGIRPQFHVFVGSKASWFEIADQLPRFDRFPPATQARSDGSLPGT